MPSYKDLPIKENFLLRIMLVIFESEVSNTYIISNNVPQLTKENIFASLNQNTMAMKPPLSFKPSIVESVESSYFNFDRTLLLM